MEGKLSPSFAGADDDDFILSQDIFCTPDYITPDNLKLSSLDCTEEDIPCPNSPDSKKRRQEDALGYPLSPIFTGTANLAEVDEDMLSLDDEVNVGNMSQKTMNYVSPYAAALRCRVMPPPCIINPYVKDASETDVDPFGDSRAKCAALFPGMVGARGLSRYHTDFHEIEQIGSGNFSRVFKVLKRIDGCHYAIKHSTRQLNLDCERMKALMEVQALAALGFHENIVGYYSSWFEDNQLYIQLEMCDCSLSLNNHTQSFTEKELLKVLHEIAKALQFIHVKGIAHLDVKPDNIYVKDGVYKLGDFGCATLLDKSLPVEEGDAHYMPQEILNEKYDHLDKVDIFSLGATIYELVDTSPLRESGSCFLNSISEERFLTLPAGYSLEFKDLLKTMMDSDPIQRPSARALIENPIFDGIYRN